MIKARLAEPDAAEGAILDGFPRTVPQAEALDRLLAAQGSRVRGALYVEVDKDELVRRLSGRRVCTGPGQHVYHVDWKPPKVPGICDIDGSPLEQRADDRPETDPGAPGEAAAAHVRGGRLLRRPRDALYPVRGDQPIDEVTEALLHAVETACRSPEMGHSDRRVTLKSAAQIEKMAVAGRLVADVLDRVGAEVRAGVTTLELDAMAEQLIRERGGIPSFIGVPGHLAPYRHSLCISLDEEVVHGIPGKRRIQEGQIVSVDAGAIVDGWHGDAARTWIVGDAPEEVRRLVAATREAMLAGIAAARPGNTLSDISGGHRGRGARRRLRRRALVRRPRHRHGDARGAAGHQLPHRQPRPASSSPGCAWPSSRCSRSAATTCASRPDGWTVETRDGSLAAHWEHTIAVTADGPRILTINDSAPADERPLGLAGS